LSESLSRKRSHDEMTGHAVQSHPPSGGHSRSASVASQQQDLSPSEAISPRARTIKRPDPPVNEHGKFVCNVSPECAEQTFDRKCEWR
jgi:hypothetical protein